MREIGRRGLLRGAGLLGTALALGACARIPTSGDVHRESLSGAAASDVPYVQPQPPADGASPEQIVSGFVLAGVGPEDDFGVARQYLTSAARASWDPAAGVTLYSAGTELAITVVDRSSVRLSVQAVGHVDRAGVRTLYGGASAREVELGVVKEDGQWRISDPPAGIFLSDSAFSLLFRAVRLYFLDPRQIHLVPDPRWFFARDVTASALSALESGPTAPFTKAVRTAIPESAHLGSAPVSAGGDGVLQLELPGTITSLGADARDLAIAQIQATLRSVPALSDVKLLREGKDLEPPADGPSRALPGHRPIAAGAQGVVSLADVGAGAKAEQMIPALAKETVHAPAMSQASPLAAALRKDRSAVVLCSSDGSIPRREVAVGADLLPPRIDDAGFVWSPTRTASGALLALSSRSTQEDAKVDASWLDGRRLLSFDIAADATRVLVLSSDDGTPRLDLSAVVRDEHGVPRALAEPVQLPTALSSLRMATWYDESTVLLLGEDTESAAPRAQIMGLQEDGDRLPAPPATVDWVAGTGVTVAVWATTSDGRLLRVEGSSWGDVDMDARDPSFY
ncbi:LpqB family beta-propeller domain-containing protein [Brachybacterium sp. ACRRE]|uniref:LpqB family beta-propeller domain-containing protein n=1 Tax=Brachybacterium sp. ACRRE TaxID=2918184 RepID=UPI001EF27916|nr:LpqB family beta-propeller domain-containing protein [Brachybacterium sp. ACRRE]MCG7309956.1 LpqB family beta-propeller domain-containing protein [Brachybacterium sp. ACRRE]